jgi:hypothetical protein
MLKRNPTGWVGQLLTERKRLFRASLRLIAWWIVRAETIGGSHVIDRIERTLLRRRGTTEARPEFAVEPMESGRDELARAGQLFNILDLEFGRFQLETAKRFALCRSDRQEAAVTVFVSTS